MTSQENEKELIIPVVSPYFLNKDTDWFSENRQNILSARKNSSEWKSRVLVIGKGMLLKPTQLIETFIDLGYTRTDRAILQGEFSGKGAFFRIAPVGNNEIWQIEFWGDQIERVSPIGQVAGLPKTILGDGQFGELARLRKGDYVVHQDHGIGIFRGFDSEKTQITKPPFREEGSFRFFSELEQAPNFSGRQIANKFSTQNPKEESGLTVSATSQFSTDGQGEGFSEEFRGLGQEKNPEGFFVIEYAPPKDGHLPDILRVPISLVKKITPYYGFEKPTVHRLGSATWFTTRKKVHQETLQVAKDLLELYATRHMTNRPPWNSDPEMERLLEESFLHLETTDQRRAMEEISRDLDSSFPMDRLLCGDVGFGKTEVALRVTWRAVLSGMQAVILSPTTVLADQHFRVFSERLCPLGVKVVMLSRLVSKRDQSIAIRLIASGEADVVIGTQRILSSDVSFKKLGFLVIDEEQRFGVLQKEKLKKMRAGLDTLSLSATPIPRTMSMTVVKLRPVSTLRTPPIGRRGVKTFVLPYSRRIIIEAIEQEIQRGGQAYFLHNRIDTMHGRIQELERILPKRKIGFIHGRMGEREIIKTMESFRQRELDVLVATTIIENGLDISSVNTLVVADALRLGLGQAHQLRGRVGRSVEQAYAYFLYSPRKLTDIALERLQALRESENLGSGFELAMKDLEIRGAGNILGRQQSGSANAVGLNLYLQMLGEAVERLRNS